MEKDNKIGSLTKSKIERLNREFAEDNKIYEKYLSEQQYNNLDDTDDNIFDLVFGGNKNKKLTKLPERIRAYNGLKNNLVIISGKAGSGKTSEMLLLIKKLYEEKINQRTGYYVTFNKLLASDVRLITDQYQVQNKIAISTIHKFFWKITNRWKIILIMTNKRREALKLEQIRRYLKYRDIIINLNYNLIELDNIILLTGDCERDRGDVNYFLRMISKIKKGFDIKLDKSILLDRMKIYHESNLDYIDKEITKDVFLKDYYQVLRYILLGIYNPDELYEKLEVSQLSDKDWESLFDKEKICSSSYLMSKDRKKAFKELIKRRMGAIKGWSKVLFIDEAQDCHPLERDIFLSIWKEKNIVVCSGGKEQLIRHSEECNWRLNDITGKTLHNVITIEKHSKTYRMKPNLVKLCNFIAEKFEIKLDLSAHKTDIEDLGNVIIEFGDDKNYTKSKKYLMCLMSMVRKMI